eukprot:7384670-Prymnesium_polylepis.1
MRRRPSIHRRGARGPRGGHGAGGHGVGRRGVGGRGAGGHGDNLSPLRKYHRGRNAAGRQAGFNVRCAGR